MRLAAALAAMIFAACASPGMPPGGPVDTQAPQIERIVPDSGKTGTTPPHVIFRFDEVVSERPSAAPSLAALFLISPRDGEPRVEWHRQELEIKPRRGWRKNTAYTITMLPGLSDLRGNTRNTGVVTMFSTGTSIPASKISGTLFNWVEGRQITRGLIEARPVSDTSLVYIGSPDSLGNFTLPNVPAGQYIIRGFSDDNTNRALDPRESFDSASVSLTDSSRVELYAFVHDSVGARLQGARVIDSMTVELQFDNPIATAPPVTAAMVRVRAPDSTDVGVLSVSPPAQDTSAATKRLRRAIPPRSLTIKLPRPLRPQTRYRIRVTDIRNLTGVVRTSEVLLETPAPPKLPAAGAPAAAPPGPPPPPSPSAVKR